RAHVGSSFFPYTSLFRSSARSLARGRFAGRAGRYAGGGSGSPVLVVYTCAVRNRPAGSGLGSAAIAAARWRRSRRLLVPVVLTRDRKSTRLNSSHVKISY